MHIRFPAPISRSARVALVAPSGPCRTPGAIESAVQKVAALGFTPVLGDSLGQVYGHLSGPDMLRASDINRMFADPAIDAIFCVRGGYGAPRILHLLDYPMIACNPKPFLGYSDITAIHSALFRLSGLQTFHGPMPVSDWVQPSFDPRSMAHLLAMLTGSGFGPLRNPAGYPLHTVNKGRAKGPLLGGNLSLVSGLCGTPWTFDPTGAILFLEDIGEKTYKLDHMLTQLRNAGYFDACAGVVFGEFTDCEIEYPGFGLTLEEIVRDIVAPCGKPILMGLRAGHCQPTLTLPLGAVCELDAGAGTIVVKTR